jgi:hypothetical protein
MYGCIDDFLIETIARSKHDAVIPEPHGLAIAIGCRMSYNQNRHFSSVTGPLKDTLKKAENATVGKIKSLNFNDLKAAARNFSVSP